ncbi:sugar ABC transporter ATP-binding protein (plasmid) [Rhodococcus globerulus]|uniref:sugar ABC transporter ATP-binding protein n=1 Tax=Rhodococcus globerulus TaxID=33008 RepID=UPI0039EC6FB2
MRSDNDPALSIRDVRIEFGPVAALSGVNLTVHPGEVHALIGHNGSGKSTLVKILAGYYNRTAGSITVAGTPFAHRISPHDVRNLGVAFVHQDLGLVPNLSVADNIGFSSRGFLKSGPGIISWRKQRAAAQQMLLKLGLDLDVSRDIETLSPVEQTVIAIARSLAEHDHVKLLILDEPTARLPKQEVARLLSVVRALAASGTGILFISHRLDEVLDVCDTVTVFREGHDVACFPAAGQTHDSLVSAMVGAEEYGRVVRAKTAVKSVYSHNANDPVLELTSISTASVSEISLKVRPGEVVALTGAVGSGISDLARVAYGLEQPRTGTIHLSGRLQDGLTVAASRKAGSAYISSKRVTEAGFSGLSLTDNIALHSDGTVPQLKYRAEKTARTSTSRMLEEYAVLPPSPDAQFQTLSGGNQQKVLLGKWLNQHPNLLILEEPTQGVDPASRVELYKLTRAALLRGLGVLWLTTDLDEIPHVADRVVVMYSGRSVLDRSADDVSVNQLIQAVLTGKTS